jgi:hypothetical protein
MLKAAKMIDIINSDFFEHIKIICFVNKSVKHIFVNNFLKIIQ